MQYIKRKTINILIMNLLDFTVNIPTRHPVRKPFAVSVSITACSLVNAAVCA